MGALMPFSAIFQFYGFRKTKNSEKATDFTKVTDKLYHINILPREKVKLQTLCAFN